MSATTDTLLDKLGEVEVERDEALAELAQRDAKLDAVAHASALIAEHEADLVFLRQLREQLEGLGLTPDVMAAKVGALARGPLGRLLGAGKGDDGTGSGPLFG